jgi:hypothetical protein
MHKQTHKVFGRDGNTEEIGLNNEDTWLKKQARRHVWCNSPPLTAWLAEQET